MRTTNLLLVSALAFAGLGACTTYAGEQAEASAGETEIMLKGNLVYRERIALPPGSTAIVSLEDVSLADAPSPTIASQTIELDGRQIPIPFMLDVDADELSSAGAIRCALRYTGRTEISHGPQTPPGCSIRQRETAISGTFNSFAWQAPARPSPRIEPLSSAEPHAWLPTIRRKARSSSSMDANTPSRACRADRARSMSEALPARTTTPCSGSGAIVLSFASVRATIRNARARWRAPGCWNPVANG